MPEEKRCTGPCGETKSLDDFTPNQDQCRECRNIYVREKRAGTIGNTRKIRKFTENEKIISRLGVLEGGKPCHELEKAIAVLKTANKALAKEVKRLDEIDARSSRRTE